MDYLWAVLLIIASLAGWVANLLGLPGNWTTVGLTAVYAFWGPQQGRLAAGSGVVVALCLLATAGEVIEFLTAAWGAKRAGGSKRGAALALAGSLVGGIAGLFLGLPIPVVGSLVSAVLLGAVGALAGAMLGERWIGKDMDESWRVGSSAFWGRIAGTLGKSLVGAVMVVLVLAAVVV